MNTYVNVSNKTRDDMNDTEGMGQNNHKLKFREKTTRPISTRWRLDDQNDSTFGRYNNFWIGISNALSHRLNQQCKPFECHNKQQSFDAMQALSYVNLRNQLLLHPSGYLKLYWDIFMNMFTLANCIFIPYSLAFNNPEETTFDTIFQSIGTIFYTVDMTLMANTAAIDPLTGLLITNRFEILKIYCRFWFWVDLISTFPSQLIYRAMHPHDYFTASYLELLRLAQFLKLMNSNKIQQFLPTSKLFGMLIVLLQLLLTCHIFGCFWWYLGKYNNDKNQEGYPSNWIEAFTSPSHDSILDQYIIANYWALYTMVTIGYGDIHATNTKERVVVCMVAICGGLILGIVLNHVTRLVESSNPQARIIDMKMSEFRAYLSEGGKVNDFLKSKAISAYSYYLKHKKDTRRSEDFDGLPPSLMNKLVTNVYGSTINRIHILSSISNTFGQDFVINAIMRAKPYSNISGEIIAEIGDIATDMTFILRGSVQLWRNADIIGYKSREIKVEGFATSGYYFGDFEYHLKSTRLVNYSAYSDCDLLSLTYEDIDRFSSQYEDAGIAFSNDILKRFSNYKYTSSQHTQPLDLDCINDSGDVWVDGKICSYEQSRKFLENENFDKENTVPTVSSYYVVNDDIECKDIKIKNLTNSEILRSGFLHSQMPTKRAWDIINMLLTIAVIFVTTIQVGFGRNPEHEWLIFSTFSAVIFLTDIILTFFTAYQHPKISAYVIDRSLIAQRYLKGMFIVDLLSSLPFERIQLGEATVSIVATIRLLRLLKLLRALKVINYFKILTEKNEFNPTLVKMGILFLQVLAANHFIACVWWAWSINLSDEGSSWIDDPDMVYSSSLRSAPLLDQYVSALYWTLVSLLGIGYGDIVAANTIERIANIFIMLFASSLFSFIMAKVSEILQEANSHDTKLNLKISETREYLVEKAIPKAVAESILKFVHIKAAQSSLYDESSMLSCLPCRISDELFLLHRSKVIQLIPIFNYIPNKSIALYIYNMLSASFYDESEFIFCQGENVTEIKFLVAGKATLFRNKSFSLSRKRYKMDTGSPRFKSQDKADLIGEACPGDFFCYTAIMNSQRETMSLKTTEPCSVYSLQKRKVLQFLKDHPSAAFNLQVAFIEAIRVQTLQFQRRYEKKRRESLFNFINVQLRSSKPDQENLIPRLYHAARRSSADFRQRVMRNFFPRRRARLHLFPAISVQRESLSSVADYTSPAIDRSSRKTLVDLEASFAIIAFSNNESDVNKLPRRLSNPNVIEQSLTGQNENSSMRSRSFQTVSMVAHSNSCIVREYN